MQKHKKKLMVLRIQKLFLISILPLQKTHTPYRLS